MSTTGSSTVVWPPTSTTSVKQAEDAGSDGNHVGGSDSGMSCENSPRPSSPSEGTNDEHEHPVAGGGHEALKEGGECKRMRPEATTPPPNGSSPLDFSMKPTGLVASGPGGGLVSAVRAPPLSQTRSHSLDSQPNVELSALSRQHRSLLSSLLPHVLPPPTAISNQSAFHLVQPSHTGGSASSGPLQGAGPPHGSLAQTDTPQHHPGQSLLSQFLLPSAALNLATTLAHQQQQQQQPSNNNNNNTSNINSTQSRTPPAIFGGNLNTIAPLPPFNGKLPITSVSQSGASVRPFKAYNPADPWSALQITPTTTQFGAVVTNNNNNNATNDQLLHQYRQLLAQGALAASARPTTVSTKPPLTATTPSPPQVTSTSHPHTEGSGPKSNTTTGAGVLPLCNAITQPVIRSLKHQQQQQQPTVSQPASVIVDRSGQSASSSSALAAIQTHPMLISPKTPSECSSRSKGGGNKSSLPDEAKDDAYWERRRKNNEAAKRSRDSRRQKEDEIAMRAALLEQENLRLRLEVAQLKAETEKLRQMLLNS